MEHDHEDNSESFCARAKHHSIRFGNVSGEQERLRPLLVPVKLTIKYHTRHTYSEKKGTTQEGAPVTAILEKSEVKRKKTMSRLFLNELQCTRNAASALLSSKLSRLGIEPSRRKGVITRIVRRARKAAAEIKAKKSDRRRAVSVRIVVAVKWFSNTWRCRQCLETELKRSLKEMLERQRVKDYRRSASCAICLRDFGVRVRRRKRVVRTACSHEFHEKCLFTWLLETPSCPLCRFDMSIF
ncbi:hypothetical protein TIFTF001_011027 [Ficus carica]|uniref:RING-type domain-containing protein n=1 Tax=Ficus carica TaxID=3494 RepID=A0AA88ADA5_FICCA|nr:hypothetical protein TIFTF001_011027 [Ficus carica]